MKSRVQSNRPFHKSAVALLILLTVVSCSDEDFPSRVTDDQLEITRLQALSAFYESLAGENTL